MISLQSKLQKIGAALVERIGGTVPVYHYWRTAKSFPYCVWTETGEGSSLRTDRTNREQAIEGEIHYFTQTEYDPVCDAIQEVLNENMAVWSLRGVDYEEDTNVIHFTWDWTVINRG